MIRAIERAIETAHKDQFTDQRKSGEGEKLGELNVSPAGDSLIETLAENLSIETLGGVATPVITRGAPLPVRMSQIFSTAADNQTSVEIHLLRGVRPMAADNTSLGKFQLDGILPSPRGLPQIEVTFDIDANGILKVSAQDKATGHSKQLSIKAASKLSKAESERIDKEAAKYKKQDQEQNDLIKAREKAENEILASRKFLSDLGDRLAGSERAQLYQKIDETSAVLENKNADASIIAKAADNLSDIRKNFQKSLNPKEHNDPSMDVNDIISLFFGERKK
jgi:molecular chaperone DnaK